MRSIISLLDVTLRWALVLLAIVMVVTVSWQVFSRYALRAPSSLVSTFWSILLPGRNASLQS